MTTRQPSNTLILTKLPDAVYEDPTELLEILHAHTLELVALPHFQRVLLICPLEVEAQGVKQILRDKGIPLLYLLRNNDFVELDVPITEQVDYLELPLELASRRFLISPPLSPPAEWDHWDKVEEGPNKVAYSPDDLSHLLWEKLGGGKVRKLHDIAEDAEDEDKEKVTHEVLLEQKQGVPAIVIDADDEVKHSENRSTLPKTAMPM